MDVLILLALLQIKHGLSDFVLQSAYIIHNRHAYGHPGGLLHVGIHAAGTLLALIVAGWPLGPVVWAVLLAEMVVHYHIDWTKDNFGQRWKLTQADRVYWWLMGLDQALHQLTYLAMAVILVRAAG